MYPMWLMLFTVSTLCYFSFHDLCVIVDLWCKFLPFFNLPTEGQGSDRTGSGSGLDLSHSDRVSQSLEPTDSGG